MSDSAPFLTGCYAVADRLPPERSFHFDEPEAALSPQRQLAFATLIDERVRAGGVQVILATHAPLLMTLPGARVLQFDGTAIHPCAPEDTAHWQITRSVLANPRAFWRTARDGA